MADPPRDELIKSAQDGDVPALAALARDICPDIERQLARYPVSDEDRRDLLQSTLMQVVRKLGSFRGESSFATWLFRVTANEALMMMRSRRRRRARLVEGLDLEELDSLAHAGARGYDGDGPGAVGSERYVLINDALAELPESHRAVVIAHYQLELGLHEIAERLKVSESAVRSRLHRARLRLRSVLAQEGEPGVAA
jgi:RNA polymerase sigma-70 factor, ECF subfamily